jgi:predicted  nucleic acid-binding Zn-ribbon protein
MNIQTNREYQSILKEIEDTKASTKHNEDELLILTEQLESMQNKIVEISQQCDEDEEKLAAESKKIKAAATKLENKKKKIIKTRNTQAKKVNERYLKRYETLKERRNGLAVAGVTNGVCLGCNMNIPPQMFNELLKEDSILSCPTCNRMMYHKAEVSEEE